MSVKYKLHQNQMKSSSYYGKWFARTVVSDVVELEDLAEKIQRNCSMKKSDVIAVLSELSEVFRDELLNGNRVVLKGIGSFKVTIKGTYADKPENWKPLKCVKRGKITYIAETVDIKTSTTHTRCAKALVDMKLEELKEYTTDSKV